MLLYYLSNTFFFLIFFIANFFHVTRQSFGICKFFCKNYKEIAFQKYLIYIFNFFFFFIAFLRFYTQTIPDIYLLEINTIVIISLVLVSIYYIFKFGFSYNYLTFLTGLIIFYPACFVSKPVHVIIMGVTMHYSQYLFLTQHIYIKKSIKEIMSNTHNSDNKKNNLFFRFFIIIFFYSLIMTTLSMFGKFDDSNIKHLILIPIIGQMIHFYLDSQVWKFSEKYNRENVLFYLSNLFRN
jgi:hypothetical protein